MSRMLNKILMRIILSNMKGFDVIIELGKK